MQDAMPSTGDISLRQVEIINGLVLAAMGIGAWLSYSAEVAGSVLVGGLIATVSFRWLKRDLTKLLAGPLRIAKVRFFIGYYARLSVLAVLLFFLIRYRLLHIVGLLVGLSTVLASIVITMAGTVRKIYFSVKEAS